MKVVYIAGPYSNGDVAVNVRNAIEVGMRIADLGHYPLIPHLTHFAHLLFPRPYEYWLELDNRILERCDVLYRMSGSSSGADKELELAKKLGVPVTNNYTILLRHLLLKPKGD